MSILEQTCGTRYQLGKGSQIPFIAWVPAAFDLADRTRYGVSAANPVSDSSHDPRLLMVQLSLALSMVARKLDSISNQQSRRRALLMARVQDGDGEACRTLLDDIGPMLMNFLRRRIADRDVTWASR